MSTATMPATPNTQHPIAARRQHVLDLDDFSRDEIIEVLETTASMKEVLGRSIKQVPALRGKTVVNMFFEDSTRTRISFELSAMALSANVVAMNGKVSCVEKG
jgi:aspartate carbamoyltransferase catalytic subunit